jgi:hypothetical protein
VESAVSDFFAKENYGRMLRKVGNRPIEHFRQGDIGNFYGSRDIRVIMAAPKRIREQKLSSLEKISASGQITW